MFEDLLHTEVPDGLVAQEKPAHGATPRCESVPAGGADDVSPLALEDGRQRRAQACRAVQGAVEVVGVNVHTGWDLK